MMLISFQVPLSLLRFKETFRHYVCREAGHKPNRAFLLRSIFRCRYTILPKIFYQGDAIPWSVPWLGRGLGACRPANVLRRAHPSHGKESLPRVIAGEPGFSTLIQ